MILYIYYIYVHMYYTPTYHGPGEFEDGGDDGSLRHGQRLGAHGRPKRLGGPCMREEGGGGEALVSQSSWWVVG